MARKGGKSQSTPGAGGAKTAEGEKLPGGSAANKGADRPGVKSPPTTDKTKDDGLMQRSGSSKKLPEVSEDAFAKEPLKPDICGTSEERSDDPSRPGSSKTASTKDDVEEKSKAQSRNEDSSGVEQTRKDAKGMSEPKREAAEAKTTEEIAEANTATAVGKESRKADEEKAVASATEQDKGDVSRSATAEENKELLPDHIQKQGDHVSGAGPENQQKRRTLSVPHTAEEISALTSAFLKIPMPEEVVEAEKNFEKAEDVFTKSKDRAEELVQESKDLKGDAEATKEAKREAAAATAEAKSAEATLQQAIKEEVRAFLDLNEKDTNKPAAETDEADNKDQRLRAGEAKETEAAAGKTAETIKAAEGGKEAAAAAEGEEDIGTRSTAQSTSGGERGKAEEAGVSKAATEEETEMRKQEGVAEEEKRRSEGSVLRPALKVSPAHLLEYSKRQSSDRAAILAALAVVGLDTPETRALVEAAEQEAAATAEQEAAAAAAKTAAESSDGELSPTAALTAFQKRTLAKLEGNQQYVLLLQQRMQEEIEALRGKYDRLMEPVFDERAHILFTGGDDEQEDERECERKAHETGEGGKDKEGSDRKEEKQGDAAGSPKRKGEDTETAGQTAAALLRNEVGTRALPGFWLQAFSNHSLLASLIGQRDKPLFLYLQNVRRVFHMEKAEGFSLVFEFGDNPFFTPQTLTKTFKMKQDEEGGDWVVARTEGTAIQWAEGMDVTVRVIMRKQLNMRTRHERMVKEYITEKSFFYFFKNSVVPTEEELDAMSDEEQTRVFTQLKTEYDAGVTIRDLIIPYALSWYLGTASEEAEISSGESETEAETPSAAKKRASAVAEAPPVAEESTASSFASWLGF